MRRTPGLSFVLVIVVGMLGGGLAAGVSAQDGTPVAGHRHEDQGAPAATPGSESPYADRYDSAAPIRALTPDEIAQIERGEGAGFALAAELNGVPGPRHVLDLAHDLGLAHDQVTQVRRIYEEMQAAVIPAGRRYLDAQGRLEADFRAGALAESDLPARVAEVARLEGELASAHLMAHLRTAKVLTAEQVAAYNRLRGYE